jgi:hypothetical protein
MISLSTSHSEIEKTEFRTRIALAKIETQDHSNSVPCPISASRISASRNLLAQIRLEGQPTFRKLSRRAYTWGCLAIYLKQRVRYVPVLCAESHHHMFIVLLFLVIQMTRARRFQKIDFCSQLCNLRSQFISVLHCEGPWLVFVWPKSVPAGRHPEVRPGGPLGISVSRTIVSSLAVPTVFRKRRAGSFEVAPHRSLSSSFSNSFRPIRAVLWAFPLIAFENPRISEKNANRSKLRRVHRIRTLLGEVAEDELPRPFVVMPLLRSRFRFAPQNTFRR